MPTFSDILEASPDVLSESAPAGQPDRTSPVAGATDFQSILEASPDLFPGRKAVPQREKRGVIGEAVHAAVAPIKALAKAPSLLTMSDDEWYQWLKEESAQEAATEPADGITGGAARIAGGLAGGVAEFAVAEAGGTAVAGPVGSVAAPALAFAGSGSVEAARSAGLRALQEGKTKEEVVRISRNLAGIGAATGAGSALVFGGTGLIPKTASALARTAGTAGAGVVAGVGSRLAENIAEKKEGLDVSPTEGLLEQAIIMGLLPTVLHAKDLYRQARAVKDSAIAKTIQKSADEVAKQELAKADVSKSNPKTEREQALVNGLKNWKETQADDEWAKLLESELTEQELKSGTKPTEVAETPAVRRRRLALEQEKRDQERGKRPNVPGTTADQQVGAGQSVVEEVRSNELFTRADLQEHFRKTGARVPSNEEATDLLKKAWRREPEKPSAIDQILSTYKETPQPEEPMSISSTSNEASKMDTPPAAEPEPRTEVENRIIERHRQEAQAEFDAAVSAGDKPAIRMAQKRLMQVLKVQQAPTAPAKPAIVPKPDLPNVAGSKFRPEVPGTEAEAEKGISVIDEIKGSGAKTIADIQRLFPQAQLNREAARRLRDQAWGKQAEPEAKPKPPEPPGPAAETVEEPPPKPPVAPDKEVSPEKAEAGSDTGIDPGDKKPVVSSEPAKPDKTSKGEKGPASFLTEPAPADELETLKGGGERSDESLKGLAGSEEWSRSDQRTFEQIKDWRARQKSGDTEPQWGRWSEWTEKAPDGSDVQVFSHPASYSDGKLHSMELRGNAVSNTGYYSHIVQGIPEGISIRDYVKDFIGRRAEETKKELAKRAKFEKRQGKEKGKNAVQPEAAQPVRSLRQKSESGPGEVSAAGPGAKDDARGSEEQRPEDVQASPPVGGSVKLGQWPENEWSYEHLKKLSMTERANRSRYLGLRDKGGLLEVSAKKIADRAKQRLDEVKAESAKPKASEPPPAPEDKKPDPEWQVTVQAPQEFPGKGTVPGYIQIDKVTGGEKEWWSSNPEKLRELGYEMPDFSKLPSGKYKLIEAAEKVSSPVNKNEEKQSQVKPTPLNQETVKPENVNQPRLLKSAATAAKNTSQWPTAAEGEEVTFMPYGPEGSGYYANKAVEKPDQAAASPKEETVQDVWTRQYNNQLYRLKQDTQRGQTGISYAGEAVRTARMLGKSKEEVAGELRKAGMSAKNVEYSVRNYAPSEQSPPVQEPKPTPPAPANEIAPSTQKKGFDAKQAKAQKKFLLTEIDKAIEEAPESVRGEWRDSGMQEENKRVVDALSAAPPEHLWAKGVRTENPEFKVWAESTEPQFEDLFKKYNAPKEFPGSAKYKNLAGETEQRYGPETYNFRNRLEQVKYAIEKKHAELVPKITIEVPHDGVFEIINDKQALRDFKEKAQRFPTTAPKVKQPGFSRETETKPAPLGGTDKDSVRKAASAFISDNTTRYVITHVWSDGKTTVATNGRALIRISKGIGGTETKPILVKPTGEKGPEHVTVGKTAKKKEEGVTYPNYNQVIPKPEDMEIIAKDLDSARLFTVLRQAQEATTEKSNSIKLWQNKDGSIGASANDVETGSYAHNVQDDAKAITALNPQYLIDAINSARLVGDEKITLLAHREQTELSPIQTKSDNTESVIMPMRLSAVPTGEGNTIEGVRAEAEKAFGALSDRVSFVHEPDNPSAAYTDRNKIVVNAAKVAPGTVEKVMLEEGLHGVWNEPAVQDAWKEFRNTVSEYEIAAERAKRKGLDTSRETLKEEAAIAKLLAKPDAPLAKRLWDTVIAALDKLFGVKVGDSREELLNAARTFLRGGESGDTIRVADVQERHPQPFAPQSGSGKYDFSKMTLENVKALRAKAARFHKSAVESGDAKEAKRSLEEYSVLDAELKGRLSDINTPPGQGLLYAAPTTGKAPIEQYTDELKKIEAAPVSLREKFKQAFEMGQRLAAAKDTASAAFAGLKATGDRLVKKFEGINTLDDLLRAKGELSGSTETRGWQTYQWVKWAKKAVPRTADQVAIRKWVDAGGDAAKLQEGARETKPEFRQAYVDAQNLSPENLKIAQEARKYFEAKLDEAISAGVLEDGLTDYIHRIYENHPAQRDRAVAYVQSGILRANPSLAKHRVFDFDWQAEKEGYKPVQSFIPAIAEYETSLSRAIAARKFIAKANEMMAPDNRPIIDIKGVGIPIKDGDGERTGTLIKPQFNPGKANTPGTANYRGDYVTREFPALQRWKWVAADSDEKPIFVQGDVSIHPDYVHRIVSLLEPSRVRYGRLGSIMRPALAISSAFKQTMLDLSGFHQVQIAVHAVEHKVNPFNLVKDIDFENQNVQGLLKGGVTIGGDYHYSGEGLFGGSLTRQIPVLGPLAESYHNWLFRDFIPRVKMTMALKALERNRERYAGKLSEEQIFNKTAMQANSAFGGINYTMLERSKTAQDIARLIMLAPDFLEARGRFAAEALSRGGKRFGNEQRTALLLGALTMYTAARVLNKVTDDQYHFEAENAFSWVINGQAYGLRTVQGDILHLLEKPLQFWMHRLNPVFGRTALEVGTQRDEFGRKRSFPEIVWDSASNIMPISLRSSRERSLWESLANGFGITDRRWQDTDKAFSLAKKWKDKHGIGERGEFIYDPDKDPLRRLKIALSRSDDSGAASEIKKLVDDKTYSLERLDQYFARYGTMAFTGSRANDRKFMADLSDDEKITVEAAKQHKEMIRKLYQRARGQYRQAVAQ